MIGRSLSLAALVLGVSVCSNIAHSDEIRLEEMDVKKAQVPAHLVEEAISYTERQYSGSAGEAYGELSSAKLLTTKGVVFEAPAYLLTIGVCSLRSTERMGGKLYCHDSSSRYVVSDSCRGICWRDSMNNWLLTLWSVQCEIVDTKVKLSINQCKIVEKK